MATVVANVKPGTRAGATPNRVARPQAAGAKPNCWLGGSCLLIVSLLAPGAVAQITEPLLPLLPNPSPLAAPTAPAGAPGEQPTAPGQTVVSRPRPEYDPIGIRLGDFFWYPRGELDESYNSNIFATTTAPTYDLITSVLPSFDLLSIFPRSSLNLHANAWQQIYADHPAQNTQDGTIAVDGTLGVSGGSSLFGNAQVAHQHISYGSPNNPGNIAQPVTYWSYLARGGYQATGRRFTYGVDAGISAAQYNAAPLVGGGVSPQSTQDASVSDVAINAGYEIVPDFSGYVRVDGALYDYWHTLPGGGTRPNSRVYRADVGLQIAPRHLIYGQVYVGYLVQDFAASSLGSTSNPDFGGRLTWTVTPLTTLTFGGLRTFNTGNTTSGVNGVIGPTGSGYLTTTVAANADHELRRDVLLNVNASYENDSFQGISRTDNVYTAGAGFRYLINRNLFLGGFYTYSQRSSSIAGLSYTQNLLTLRVGTQF
jgi:hypothetical protein